MLKGFAAGSLVLIVLYVVVQPGASSKTASASNAFVQGMRRLMSPQVAGIGDHSKTAATGTGGDKGTATPDSAAQGESSFGRLFTT